MGIEMSNTERIVDPHLLFSYTLCANEGPKEGLEVLPQHLDIRMEPSLPVRIDISHIWNTNFLAP